MTQTKQTFFVSSQTQKNKNVKCSGEHLYMQKYDMFFYKILLKSTEQLKMSYL